MHQHTKGQIKQRLKSHDMILLLPFHSRTFLKCATKPYTPYPVGTKSAGCRDNKTNI